MVQPPDFANVDDEIIAREAERLRRRERLNQLAERIGGPGTRVADPNLFQRFLQSAGEQYQRVNQAAQDIQQFIPIPFFQPDPLRPRIPEGFVSGAPEALQPAARVLRETTSPVGLATLPAAGARIAAGGLVGAAGGATAGQAIGGDVGELAGAIGGGVAGGIPAVQRLAGRGITKLAQSSADLAEGMGRANVGNVLLPRAPQVRQAARASGVPHPADELYRAYRATGGTLSKSDFIRMAQAAAEASPSPVMSTRATRVTTEGGDAAARLEREVAAARARLPQSSAEAAQLEREVAAARGGLPPRGPQAAGPAGTPEPPARKLALLIRAAKPVRKQTEAMKSVELGRRVAQASGILETGEPRQAFRAARAPLAGELPRAQFTPPESGLQPDDITSLYETVRSSPKQFFTRLNTATALSKVLAGEIPQRAEIGLLEDMFGRDLASSILSKRSVWQKVRENIEDVINFPRVIVASFDLSAPMRQGIVLAPGHPKEFARAWGPMLRAFVSDRRAIEINQAIKAAPNFERYNTAGLFFHDLTRETTPLAQREEQFISRFIQKIPGLGLPIRASERAYVTFLNKFRYDVVDGIVNGWQRSGVAANEIMEALPGIIRFVNRASGRGELGRLSAASPYLNAAFFSPRFFTSRPLTLASLAERNSLVRKQVARDLVAFVGTGTMALGLLNLSNLADVEVDPRSPDFGKVRLGNTSLDFWAGYQQIARYTAQLLTGQRKTISGRRAGQVDPSPTRADILIRFIRSKLSPTAGVAADVAFEKTFVGEDVTPASELSQFTPLIWRDVAEAVQDEQAVGFIKTLPGIFGVGATTFERADQSQGRPVPQGALR